jgi:hypothetical protein
MTRCTHMSSGRCTNALALPLYGDRPSPGVCRICAHYDGPARGAGDLVEKVARFTGIKAAAKAVERVTGKPCGCASRQQALNSKIPFKSP